MVGFHTELQTNAADVVTIAIAKTLKTSDVATTIS